MFRSGYLILTCRPSVLFLQITVTIQVSISFIIFFFLIKLLKAYIIHVQQEGHRDRHCIHISFGYLVTDNAQAHKLLEILYMTQLGDVLEPSSFSWSRSYVTPWWLFWWCTLAWFSILLLRQLGLEIAKPGCMEGVSPAYFRSDQFWAVVAGLLIFSTRSAYLVSFRLCFFVPCLETDGKLD